MGNLTPKYFETGRAYLIGMQNYTHISSLRTPLQDVEDIAKALRLQEFDQINIERDLTKEAFIELIADIKNEVKTRDRVLFYFAGHGIARDSDEEPRGFLIPVDACRDDENTFIDMKWLVEALSELPCKHFLLILDSCFAGSIRWAENYRALGYDLTKKIYREKFERFVADNTRAWQVITSSSYDEQAVDLLLRLGKRETDPLRNNSPFASLLANVLSGNVEAGHPFGDGIITATRLFDYLDKEMNNIFQRGDIPHQQSPYYFPLLKSTKGQFVFLLPELSNTAIAALPARNRQNPYKGLLSYQIKDHHLFFGRDQAVAAIRTVFNTAATGSRVTLVSGASGIGKSSLIMAGLIPALLTEFPDTDKLRPIRAGSASTDAKDLRNIHKEFAKFKFPYILFIDQYEELSTVCTTRQKDAFEALLMKCLNDPKCHIILSIRNDFEPLFRDSPLLSLAAENRYIVPPMQRQEVKDVILQPALQSLIQIESEQRTEQMDAAFLDRIIDEALQSPGSLPLLSFALEEWYECSIKADHNKWILSEKHYKGIGGVNGALGTIVEGFTKKLRSAEELLYLKIVLLKMVSVRDGNFSRRRVYLPDLVFASGKEIPVLLLERLVVLRVVIKNNKEGSDYYYEFAHDSLLTSWKQLWEWINIEGKGKMILYEQLATTTQLWDQSNRKSEKLWADQQELQLITNEYLEPYEDPNYWKRIWNTILFTLSLGKTPKLRVRSSHIFTVNEAAFIEASIQRKRRRTVINNWFVFGISVLSLVALIFWGITVQQRNVAIQEANRNKALVMSYQASNLRKNDPTQAMNLLLTADSISPENESVRNNIYSIYAQKEYERFYTKRVPSTITNARLLAAPDRRHFIAYAEKYSSPSQFWQIQLFSDEGKFIAPLSSQRREVIQVAFSRDSKKILVAYNNAKERNGYLVLYSIAGKQIAATSTQRMIQDCTIDPVTGEIVTAEIYYPANSLSQISIIVNRNPGLTREFPRPRIINDTGISQLFFNTNGDHLLAVGTDHLTVIDPRKAHSTPVVIKGNGCFDAKFSISGKEIFAVSFRNKAAYQYKLDGVRIATYPHESPVSSVNYTPKGDTVLTGSNDGKIKYWTKSGMPAGTLDMEAPVGMLQMLPGKGFLVSLYGNGALIVDKNKIKTSFFERNATMAGMVPDHSGRYLFSSSGDGIKQWDLSYGQSEYRGTLATFGHQGKIIVASFNKVEYLNPNGTLISTIELPFEVKALKATLNGDTVFISTGKDSLVNFAKPKKRVRSTFIDFSADTGALFMYTGKQQLLRIPLKSYATGIILDEKHRRILLNMSNSSIRIYDYNGHLISQRNSDDVYYRHAAFTSTGDSILVTTTSEVLICDRNLKLLKQYKSDIPDENTIGFIATTGNKWAVFPGDKNFLFSASLSNKLSPFLQPGTDGPAIKNGSFTPDGKYLATGTDKNVIFWDLQKKTALYTLTGTMPLISGISPDGMTVLISEKGGFKLWATPDHVMSAIRNIKIATPNQTKKE